LERDDFQRRFKQHLPIGLHELLYPLLQGYDSVVIDADVEVGGTDQKFNLLVGRELQKSRNKNPQVVVTMPLLEGTDGVQKMSKSLGNAIGITEDPNEMYGRIMSISDPLMFRYYELLSDETAGVVTAIRAGSVHPMQAKKALAAEIVARHHDSGAAARAGDEFERRFQRGDLPESVPVFHWPSDRGPVAICQLLKESGIAESTAEARRLLAQGAVRVDGVKISSLTHAIDERGLLVQVGKRRVVRVVPSS
jgi:tyrosyl-tRNA synthetase